MVQNMDFEKTCFILKIRTSSVGIRREVESDEMRVIILAITNCQRQF